MSFKVTEDTLTPALAKFDANAKKGIELGMRWGESRAEQHARTNAPWTDQTGNARNGLRARYTASGNSHSLTLFHSMDYGIYLETRFSGRYAIIIPTLEAIRGELTRIIAESIKRAVSR